MTSVIINPFLIQLIQFCPIAVENCKTLKGKEIFQFRWKIANIKISPDRMGGGCTITAQCSRCHTHTNYSTSRNITCPDKIQRTEIGTRIAFGILSFFFNSYPNHQIPESCGCPSLFHEEVRCNQPGNLETN